MSIIRRIFRPGSGGPSKGVSIVDNQGGRAVIRTPFAIRTQPQESDPESTFYPMILVNEVSAVNEIPRGILPGVDEQGRIPRYEPDDPAILRRLFGIELSDE